MNFAKSSLTGAGLMLFIGVAGCGLIKPHIDCDQVARQQREGIKDSEIAQATGFSLEDVQSCSQTASSGSRETANYYQDQPHLPVIPSVPAGAVSGAHP